MSKQFVTETTVQYLAVKPNGRVWHSGSDLEDVVRAEKYWAGPGELRFERLISVIRRGPSIREDISPEDVVLAKDVLSKRITPKMFAYKPVTLAEHHTQIRAREKRNALVPNTNPKEIEQWRLLATKE